MLATHTASHRKSIALMRFLSSVANRLGVGKHVYVVGGAVRNFVIDEPIKDLDVVIDTIALNGKDSAWFAAEVADSIPVATSLVTNNYGVSILTVKEDWEIDGQSMRGEVIEIANARKESYGGGEGKGYKPHTVAPATIDEDILRREFTFNTLLWRLSELADGPDKAEIIDLSGCGLKDLQEGSMRCPRNPDIVFSDDPSRMIRAIKFLLKYRFKIPEDVRASIRKNAPKLKSMPSGHLSNMLISLFYETGVGKQALLEMDKLGLLSEVKEIVQTDKPFREALANWVDRKAEVAFLFDLMDLGMPSGKRLNFLAPNQQVRVREITVQMKAAEASEFVEVLAKPGKVLDMDGMIKESGLQGKEIRALQVAAQKVLLEDPTLVQNPSNWETRVRQVMGWGVKTGSGQFFRNIQRMTQEMEDLAPGLGYEVKQLGVIAGIPVVLAHPKDVGARRQLLVVSGHHGNEPSGPFAISKFFKQHRADSPVALSFLMCVNPTGFKRNRREGIEDSDPNREMLSGQDPSPEGELLKDHTTLIQQVGQDGVLSLHEDWEERCFYLYTQTQEGESDPVAEALLVVGAQDFPLHEDGTEAGSGVISDGIIWGADDTSIETWLCEAGIPVYTTEVPGTYDLTKRVQCAQSLIEAFAASGAKTRVAREFFEVGDEILYGKYKNKKGLIKSIGPDERGNPVAVVEPVPKGRKQDKEIGLYKFWHADPTKRLTPAAKVASRWARINLQPNQWVHEDAREVDEEQADRLWHLYHFSYGNIGKHIGDVEQLLAEYEKVWVNDVDGDDTIDALIAYKRTPAGNKIAVLASDGSPAAKKAVITKSLSLLKTEGWWAELSDRPAQLAEAAGLPKLMEEAEVRAVLRKDVTWLGEGVCKRQIGALGSHAKSIYGRPRVSVSQKQALALEPKHWLLTKPQRLEEDQKQRVWDLYSGTYGSIGLSATSLSAFLAEYELLWVQDVDGDNTIDAFIAYKRTPFGNKIVFTGTDGTSVAKRAMLAHRIALLKRSGWYTEASHKIAEITEAAGVPKVMDEAVVRAVLRKDIEWLGDGRYIRQIGSLGRVPKALYGNPKGVSTSSKQALLQIDEDTEIEGWETFLKTAPTKAVRMEEPFAVDTLEGTMQGKAGDWLAEGPEGERWPIDHNIFQKTYEKMALRRIASTHMRLAVARVVARYKEKKKVKTKDGDETTVYVYSDKQIQNRNKQKAERIEKLRKSIDGLRKQVRKDIKSEDAKTKAVALAVGLMDATYERVGNGESAKEGHFGVTGWQVKHLTVGKNKVTIKYVGKSGVKHEKVIDRPESVKAIKEAIKDKSQNDEVCDCSAQDVNEYLKPFEVTAKDLRGYHANTEMQDRLKSVRSKGGKLPDDKKEREKKLKAEFKQALEETADAVGHEPSTLKSQYLVPGLEDEFLKDGKVSEKLTKKGALTTDEGCPVCGWDSSRGCRCRIGEKICPNGHKWVVCPIHGEKIDVTDKDTHDGSFLMNSCWCGFSQDLEGRVATKSEGEKQDAEADRLVRPAPKKKPPRHDLRRERVETEDDTGKPNAENDRDLSQNYKKVADRWLGAAERTPRKDKKEQKKAPAQPPKEETEPEHKPGEVWQTDKGWAGMNPDGNVKGGFEKRDQAQTFAKGKTQPKEDEEPTQKTPEKKEEAPDKPAANPDNMKALKGLKPQEGRSDNSPMQIADPGKYEKTDAGFFATALDGQRAIFPLDEAGKSRAEAFSQGKLAEREEAVKKGGEWPPKATIPTKNAPAGKEKQKGEKDDIHPDAVSLLKILTAMDDEGGTNFAKKLSGYNRDAQGAVAAAFTSTYQSFAQRMVDDRKAFAEFERLTKMDRKGAGLSPDDQAQLGALKERFQNQSGFSTDLVQEVSNAVKGLKRKGQSGEVFAQSMAAWQFARQHLANPSKAAGQEVKGNLDDAALATRATQAHDYYLDMPTEIRSEAFRQMEQQLEEADEGTHKELSAILEGLHTASIEAGDDIDTRRELLPEPSETTLKLVKSLKKKGKVKGLGDLLQADFYSPEGMASIEGHLDELEDDDLLGVSFADSALGNRISEMLRDPDLEPWQREALREMMGELAVDRMSAVHDLLQSGKGSKKTPETVDPQVDEQVWKTAMESKPVQEAYAQALQCIDEAAKAGRGKKECIQSVEAARLALMEEILAAVMKQRPDLDKTHPDYVRVSEAIKRQSAQELRMPYRRST